MSTTRHPRLSISPACFLAAIVFGIALLALLQLREHRQARPVAHPVISELQAANSTGLRDDDGQTTDWIEIWNPSAEPVALDRWALTDDFRSPAKWRFPAVHLGPGEFLVVFATGKNRTNPAAALHANFRLDPAGEYLAIVEAGSDRAVHEFLPKYPRQIADLSFGLTPEVFQQEEPAGARGARQVGFLLQPTPGAPNADEMLGVVSDTRFSRQRGLYTNSFPLEISTRTLETQIRYTLDGTRPSLTNGLLYLRPIEITDTTVVRAVAFRAGFRPSNVDTHTFVFPQRVRSQSGGKFPSTWGVRNGGPVVADYEMDAEIVDPPGAAGALIDGLKALPTVSLTLTPEDLYGEAAGIYAHPLEHGQAWERPASFEWFRPAGKPDVRADCGVRIQGGWSRRPEESPKHSFRLRFRADYGAAELKQTLFTAPGPAGFRELILRAGCNNSWLHWSGTERRRGDLLRDQWMRDTLLELGHPSARGDFVHLYLNGLYWGVYNLVERPDAEFLAQRFGGQPEDYDSRNGENVLSGDTIAWDRMFALANAGIATPEAYAEISRLLDMPAFIDFMAVHLYGGSADIDAASNWYAARPRRADGRHVFLMWDGERSLEEVGMNSLNLDADQSPTRLFQKLRENELFRRDFAARLKQLTSTGGPLSPTACAARYSRLADYVRAAMICESARWGDYRRDVHPYREGPYELYTVQQHWEPEVRRLLQEYFPNRTATLLQQLRTAGFKIE